VGCREWQYTYSSRIRRVNLDCPMNEGSCDFFGLIAHLLTTYHCSDGMREEIDFTVFIVL
jgi:hypothetical protein